MKRKILILACICISLPIYFTCEVKSRSEKKQEFLEDFQREYSSKAPQKPLSKDKPFFTKLAEAAEARTLHSIVYDPSYVKLDYPGGDVSSDRGVCTDVVIRAYRKVGIDLQVKVHEDMKENFGVYPKIWGLEKPDPNIDHRRVPNLMAFFKRHGVMLPASNDPQDYGPGDIITWDLSGGISHIGIVSTKKSNDSKRYKVVHNIGAGPRLEDIMFAWKITGHFRYD